MQVSETELWIDEQMVGKEQWAHDQVSEYYNQSKGALGGASSSCPFIRIGLVNMVANTYKNYKSGLLCTRPEENIKSHCKVAVHIKARLIVSSFGPDSGGSEEQTTSRSVVQNSLVGKNGSLKGGCLLDYSSHRNHHFSSRLKFQCHSKAKTDTPLKFHGILRPFEGDPSKYGGQKRCGSGRSYGMAHKVVNPSWSQDVNDAVITMRDEMDS
eukprot:Gb_14291 [translate_table: standard]